MKSTAAAASTEWLQKAQSLLSDVIRTAKDAERSQVEYEANLTNEGGRDIDFLDCVRAEQQLLAHLASVVSPP